MRKTTLGLAALLSLAVMFTVLSQARAASFARSLVRFSTMYGVDGPFLGDEHAVRGLAGDDLPWRIGHVEGALFSDGSLTLSVRGLVFTNDPEVPPELRGINDEPEFRAIVSCLTENDDDTPVVNVATRGFKATRSGDALIVARVHLPNPCVAPIVFIAAADEDDWLAVTGVETD